MTASDPASVLPDEITMRDYLAAHAPVTMKDAAEYLEGREGDRSYGAVMRILAQLRYAYADAMMEARQRP